MEPGRPIDIYDIGIMLAHLVCDFYINCMYYTTIVIDILLILRDIHINILAVIKHSVFYTETLLRFLKPVQYM